MATKAPEHLILPPNRTKMPIVGLGTWQVSMKTLIIDLKTLKLELETIMLLT